jgi:hypothetical protein
LRADPQRFAAVDYPEGQPFLIRHSLLYLPVDELARLVDRLRFRPTTCHAQLPAELEMPPSARSDWCSRRRASTWSSFSFDSLESRTTTIRTSPQ